MDHKGKSLQDIIVALFQLLGFPSKDPYIQLRK